MRIKFLSHITLQATMPNPSNQQIQRLAEVFATSVNQGDLDGTVEALRELLDGKCPFPKLDLLGTLIGQKAKIDPERFLGAFDRVVDYQAMGGFVVVGQALVSFLERDFEAAMQKSREYIVKGDRWYVCDIIGERSLGAATVQHFDRALPFLGGFLGDENRWVKRSAGVAVHFFAKRVRNQPEKAELLLQLLAPHIEERQVDVVKGIGWGLKTIGKYYPDVLVPFLKEQLKAKKRFSKLMMRKALTYLPEGKKAEVESYVRGLQG